MPASRGGFLGVLLVNSEVSFSEVDLTNLEIVQVKI